MSLESMSVQLRYKQRLLIKLNTKSYFVIINFKERLHYHPKKYIKKLIAVCSLLVGLERVERSPLDFQSNERTTHTAVPIKNSSISTGIKFIAGLFSPEDFFL